VAGRGAAAVQALTIDIFIKFTLVIAPPNTVNVSVVFRPAVGFISSSQSLTAGEQAELNPYRAAVPAEIGDVSAPLQEFMSEQAQSLREQHNVTQSGGSTFPWELLTRADATPKYTIGSVGKFYNATYGIIQARYVKLRGMVAVGAWPGQPVGAFASDSGLTWEVTNDINLSAPTLIVGVLALYEEPVDDSYVWVIVEGPNIHSLRMNELELIQEGDPLVWSGTSFVSAKAAGVILGRVWKKGRSSTLPPGSVQIKFESESAEQLVRSIQNEVADIEAQVSAFIPILAAQDQQIAVTQQLYDDSQVAVTALSGKIKDERDARRTAIRQQRMDVRDLETRVIEAYQAADAQLQMEFRAADAELQGIYETINSSLATEASIRAGGDQANQQRISRLQGRLATLERAFGINDPFRMVYSFAEDMPSSQIIDTFLFDTLVTIPAGADGSAFKVKTAASSLTILELRSNDLLMGTISFAASSLTGILSWGTTRVFVDEQQLDILTPAELNGLKGFSMVLKGRYGK
jgi:hypothetical protein